jgi:hypothetical protein
VAWKLRLELVRTSCLSNELHTFRVVPLPRSAGAVFQPVRAQVQGITVAVTNFTFDGVIRAALDPPDDCWFLQYVRATRPDGGDVRLNHPVARDAEHLDCSVTYIDREILFRSGCTNVALTFGLQRKRIIEVIAQPTAAPAH